MRKRRLLAASAVLVVGLSLVACTKDETGPANTDASNPFRQKTWTTGGPIDYSTFDLSGEEVIWADFGGSVHEDFKKAYLDDFQKLTKATVSDGSPFDYAQVKAQVESKNIQYDIITGAPTSIDQGCGTLYEEVPDSKFNWAGIDDKYKSSKCSVPHGTTALMLQYNTNKYKDNPPKTCADFFDLTRFPGTRGMWTSVLGYPLEIALLADGVAPKDVYPIDYDRAFRKLNSIRSNLKLFPDLTRGQQGQANQEYDMIVQTSVRGYRGAKDKLPYAPVWGCSVGQVTTLGILKGTPRLDAALALVGYASSPAGQRKGASVRASSPVSKDTDLPDIDPLMKNYIGSFHQNEMPIPVVDAKWWSQNFDQAEQRFQQWQVG